MLITAIMDTKDCTMILKAVFVLNILYITYCIAIADVFYLNAFS